MEATSLVSFVPSELLILIAGLYVLGIFVKKSALPDKFIPVCLMAVSIGFSCILSPSDIATAILQGILCWGVSVGINQVGKQLLSKSE